MVYKESVNLRAEGLQIFTSLGEHLGRHVLYFFISFI